MVVVTINVLRFADIIKNRHYIDAITSSIKLSMVISLLIIETATLSVAGHEVFFVGSNIYGNQNAVVTSIFILNKKVY